MDVLVLLEHLSEVVDVVFEVASLVGVLAVEVGVTLLVLDFLFDVLFVEADDAFFELFGVGDVMQTFIHVILEFLLVTVLFI